MPKTPLYKYLKTNGTSTYVFPGAAEDISAAYQNDNYRMYFSKYVLLDLPKKVTSNPGGTSSVKTYFDFGTFSTIATPTSIDFKDAIIESLRNYVGNHEVTLRESRLNNTEYYYDTSSLETTSEKIFWKWCKKLNLISFEQAVPQDEYFQNLSEFERLNITDDSYFPEYLWKEREVTTYTIVDYFESALPAFVNKLSLQTSTITNIRVGDLINLIDFDLAGDLPVDVFPPGGTWSTISLEVLDVTTTSGIQDIVVDFASTITSSINNRGSIELNHVKLVKYIGEVNGVSNVQEANRAYTEVYAHIPAHTGLTPDILYRTKPDVNYRPNLVFPIIPSQYQPEIIGAELFSSPIVSNPTDYPGTYYGQFDTPDFTYTVESGDSLRRSGRLYGITGDINSVSYNGSTIDSIVIDFDNEHYAKMNITDREVSNFDQFNALEINNNPPEDFEFNSILWYYTVESNDGVKVTNLYGISFLDNPDNSVRTEDIGIKFPIYKKLAATDNQDGTAYAFSLNLNFNIIHDNPQETFNPEAINSLFSMNLFNETMKRLSSVNDSFLQIISENELLKTEMLYLKQLLYSQTDLNIINQKISNLERLLRLYSTQQIISSDTINVEYLNTSPSTVKFNNIDTEYYSVRNLTTNTMYDINGALPISITPPINKNFLVNVINDDATSITLPNSDKLTLMITKDLSVKQRMDIYISGTELSSENKKLDIYISTIVPTSNNNTPSLLPVDTLLIGDIDLPIFFNTSTSQPNSASTWTNNSISIDFSQNITLLSGNLLELTLDMNSFIVTNSFNIGDTLVLNNLFIGTQSVFNFSSQYKVNSVNNSTITLDISNNIEFTTYGDNQVLPFIIHSPSSTLLSNIPFLNINKGFMIRLTRISSDDNISLREKYLIDIQNIDY